ncbi:MAG: feruloyl-CoA synthase [Pseudomonadota bacterium]
MTEPAKVTKPDFAPLDFAPPEVEVDETLDGGKIVRSAQALGACDAKMGDYLVDWAALAPERTFLAERDGQGGWRKLSYADALDSVERLAQALIDRGFGPGRTLMILSDNSIDNALLQLAAQHIGTPAVPVSPAYSLMSNDHAKLRAIHDLIDPSLVYAEDGARFAGALEAIGVGSDRLVTSIAQAAATTVADMLKTAKTEAVDLAFAGVGPDSIAKILFTSGSTGEPKGVINTQRMLVSNQQMIAQLWHFLAEKPPVIVDWLPWNHTFGGNHNFNMVLRHGGTLYIDDGKPVPALVGKTIANLHDVSPTLYFNVPIGFSSLLDHLESDVELRSNFFRELDAVFYAGAALPQNLWERMEAASIAERGVRVPMISAWGATETAPMVTTVHFPIERAGVIGLPGPGVSLKLVPAGDKLEMRVKGPNVTPGYWRRPDLTKAAFDDEGFYKIGDAGRFARENDPSSGIVFDGRTAEDFKLSTGTWVFVGALRIALIAACAPAIQDAVPVGEYKDEVGLLIFPNLNGCRSLAGLAEDTPIEQIVSHQAVRDHVRTALAEHNRKNPGSSTRVTRALLMAEPPSIDANEITDKGYINQHAVTQRRADLVRDVLAEAPSDRVIVVP